MPTTPITKSKFRTIIRVNNIEKCKSDTESITN